MKEKLFLEMDDTEYSVKDTRPLSEEDNLLLVSIAKRYNHTFKEGSLLDKFQKNIIKNPNM